MKLIFRSADRHLVDNHGVHESLQSRTWLALVVAFAMASHVASTQTTTEVIPPERLLLIETSKGRIIVEMRPDMAPKAVERISRLARMRVYDRLQFHRVVDHFVAQTGNPNNRDGGASDLPNLEGEFMLRLKSSDLSPVATRTIDGWSGFLGSLPVQGELSRRADGTSRAWGAYCSGVAGMGRQAARDSANSEIFFMLEPSRFLDHEYTPWGRIVAGDDVLHALAVGEPPAAPDVMRSVRVAADLPPVDRPIVRIDTAGLAAAIARLRASKGADFTICDVTVPVAVGTAPR